MSAENGEPALKKPCTADEYEVRAQDVECVF